MIEEWKEQNPKQQLTDLIYEIETAASNGLLEIIAKAPGQNYTKFKTKADNKTIKKLTASLKERYDLLRFMWAKDGEYTLCMAFYYPDD